MATRARGPWGDRERLKGIRQSGHLTRRPFPVCTQCGKVLDAWTAIEPGDRPKPSRPGETQISICGYCATVHEYVEHPQVPKALQLRRLEGDELLLALADPMIRKARGLVMIHRALRRAVFDHDQAQQR